MVERVHAAGQEVMELCVEVGGTITGEHGVGSEKRQYMRLMFNEDELRVMQDIKEVFDPTDLLNPGKIVPGSSRAGGRDPGAPGGAAHAAGRGCRVRARRGCSGCAALRCTPRGGRVRVRGGGTKSAAAARLLTSTLVDRGAVRRHGVRAERPVRHRRRRDNASPSCRRSWPSEGC